MNTNTLVARGLLWVYGPIIAFVFVSWLVSTWLTESVLQVENPDFTKVLVLFGSIIIGWIWWSYRIVKWKYWAFSHVQPDESKKLYNRAIAVGLIWPTGSRFNKTEIWTQKDKEKWNALKPEIHHLFSVDTENI